MLVKTAFKYRIHPDEETNRLFRRTIGCCRAVRNACLDQWNLEYHRSNPRRLSAVDQMAELPALKEAFPYLKEVPAQPLQQAVHDLHDGIKRFFRGQNDYPSFHRKGQKESFRYPQPDHVEVQGDRVFLPKAGWVRMVMHRTMLGKVKHVTVSRHGDMWFVSFMCEAEMESPKPNVGEPVGIDLNVVESVAMSTGEIVRLPRVSAKERKQLAAAQKTFSRRKKGSKNREKARRRICSIQAKWARRRHDAQHKVTTKIAKNHGLICVEDLKVKNMTASAKGTVEEPGTNVRQKAGLNRSFLDVAPGGARRMLEYKAPLFGGRVVAVRAAGTSQECSECGHTHADNRKGAKFVCLKCGHAEHADLNAPKVILKRGLKIVSTGGLPGVACGSSRKSGRKQEVKTRKGGSPAL
jgi:putative transposase